MKNLILVDFQVPKEWSFHKAILDSTHEEWDIRCCVNNRMHGSLIKKINRYFMYFMLPLKVFFESSSIKKVIAWQQFYGIILAFYLRLFKKKKCPEITIMTFIYKKKNGILGLLYEKFISYSIASNAVKNIIVFSEHEVNYYSKLFTETSNKFRALKLGLESQCNRIKANKFCAEGYVAAGRSNRDYKFLFDNWSPDMPDLEIVYDGLEYKSAANIKVIHNCYGDEFLQKIANGKGVIIPVKDPDISSGQLVLLYAMMFGKPIIVTRSNCFKDYIEDGVEGIVIDKTREDLVNAVNILSDKKSIWKCLIMLKINTKTVLRCTQWD